MNRYAVTHSRKDRHGDIIGIGVKGRWYLDSDTAIKRIQSGTEGYYVQWPEKLTDIHVVYGTYGPYLRTDRDGTTRNNLDDLPDL